MELIVESFDALPCELETFTINGKAADSSDFGDTFGHNEKRLMVVVICGLSHSHQQKKYLLNTISQKKNIIKSVMS